MKLAPGTPSLVTGASSGIGLEIVRALARRGCRIALVARSADALDEVAAEVDALGGEGLALPADVTVEEELAGAVKRAVATFGGLRLVIANAGLGRYARVEEQPAEHAETTIRVNYLGLTRTVRLTLPHLLAGAPSHLVGMTSSAGLIPHSLASAYCASKAASNAYLATLRLEVFERGVGVSWICPGAVRTPFLDKSGLEPSKDLPLLARLLVRELSAEEVARAVVRAVEANKSEVTLPAMLRFFAWTRRLAPRFTDWLNRKTG